MEQNKKYKYYIGIKRDKKIIDKMLQEEFAWCRSVLPLHKPQFQHFLTKWEEEVEKYGFRNVELKFSEKLNCFMEAEEKVSLEVVDIVEQTVGRGFESIEQKEIYERALQNIEKVENITKRKARVLLKMSANESQGVLVTTWAHYPIEKIEFVSLEEMKDRISFLKKYSQNEERKRKIEEIELKVIFGSEDVKTELNEVTIRELQTLKKDFIEVANYVQKQLRGMLEEAEEELIKMDPVNQIKNVLSGE